MQVSIGAKCWDGNRRQELKSSVEQRSVVLQEPSNLRKWEKKLQAALGYAIPFSIMALPFGSSASAHGLGEPALAAMAVPDAVKSKILHAFDPLVDLAISLSYPIAGVMIAGGCLFIMIGNRERGMQMLQNAAIGYILVQLAPMFLNLLVGIGSTVS